jgi:hypothetical protein
MNREGTAGGISKRKQENVRQVRWWSGAEEGGTGSVCSRLEKFLLGEHGLVSHLLGEINRVKRRPSTAAGPDSQQSMDLARAR